MFEESWNPIPHEEYNKIASYLEDLFTFSKTVPFSQIEQHIEEKKNENTELEQYKQRLESQIQTRERISKLEE